MEDARELVYAENVDEANVVFAALGDLLSSVEELLDHEMAMNWSVC